jgi:hypothetical protein
MSTATRFASIDDFVKGGVEIIGNDGAPRYLFSNMFEVAKQSRPWERVVVAKNLEFTIECARAEGDSPWFLCSHDETCLVMQGQIDIHFLALAEADVQHNTAPVGAVQLASAPAGTKMGYVSLQRGHLALLPAGAAYQLRPKNLGVVLLQSLAGPQSLQRWAAICQH